ncbi:MAG: DNA polymerase I [Gammaproteobacteria bacterium]|nr:DNA polymerase I [Gammaproteobacteria bacterium]
MTAPLLVLIDGSSYLYRAFHALPPLTNAAGEPTGAMYGVINMIKKLLTEYKPDYVGVIFDAKGETFRDELYADYKAQRDAMPDALVSQIEPLHQMIQAMGLPLLAIEKVEADDVIGTLTAQAVKKKWRVLISTGDKDMAQLVSPQVTLVNTMSQTLLDPAGVEAKFGLPPQQLIEYFSLVGDSSDNIPGVPGVGPKTAVKWLKEYGTLQNLLDHADSISGKIGERLRTNQSQIPLWKTLVTIKQDVSLPIELEALKPQNEDTPTLLNLFKRFEFKNWLPGLEKKTSPTPTGEHQTHLVIQQSAFLALLKQLRQAKLLVIRTYTDPLFSSLGSLIGLSITFNPADTFYLPFQHHHQAENLDLEESLLALKPILENEHILKCGYNLKNDITVFASHHITLSGLIYDVLIENCLLHGTQGRQDLAALASRFLQKEKIEYEDIAGKGQKKLSFSQIPLAPASQYACQETAFIFELHHLLFAQLDSISTLKNVYHTIECPLISTLSHIERHGVLIDRVLLKRQSEELEKRLREIEQKVYASAQRLFNLASPKQLQEILYEHLKLPILQRTATGQPSTAEEVLQQLALDYPLPKLILEHRMLSKLKSTYTDALPLQINAVTHRIHTSYNQAGTSTGRLSSSDPNLQNIPVRNEEGRRIRKAFIAPQHHLIVSADYSQIELRLMAHFSQDKKLLAAFSNGTDIHRATAAEVWGITEEKVTLEQRRQAKVINFGILYGMSAFGLARELSTSREAAQTYIDLYFKRYPGVQDYMERAREFVHQHGYVETFFGRRIYIPDIHDRNFQRQKAAERAAINGPLQGTAADIIKRAMNSLDHALIQQKIPTCMIMQVHDELVFEVPENQLDLSCELIRQHMVQAIELSVPITVEIGKGKNWDEAH